MTEAMRHEIINAIKTQGILKDLGGHYALIELRKRPCHHRDPMYKLRIRAVKLPIEAIIIEGIKPEANIITEKLLD